MPSCTTRRYRMAFFISCPEPCSVFDCWYLKKKAAETPCSKFLLQRYALYAVETIVHKCT